MPEESNAIAADSSKASGSSDTGEIVASHGEGETVPQATEGKMKRRRRLPQALSPKRKAMVVEFFAQ